MPAARGSPKTTVWVRGLLCLLALCWPFFLADLAGVESASRQKAAQITTVAFSDGWRFLSNFLSDSGTVLFAGGGSGPDSLVMVTPEGLFQKIVSRGEPVPDRPGKYFSRLRVTRTRPGSSGSKELSINARDEVAFLAEVVACDTPADFEECARGVPWSGAFLYRQGVIRTLLLSQEPVPTLSAALWGHPASIHLNDQGQVLLLASIEDGRVFSGLLPWGLFLIHGEKMEKIAIREETTPLGTPFSWIPQILHFADTGRVIFYDASDRNGTTFHYRDGDLWARQVKEIPLPQGGVFHTAVAQAANSRDDILLAVSYTVPPDSSGNPFRHAFYLFRDDETIVPYPPLLRSADVFTESGSLLGVEYPQEGNPGRLVLVTPRDVKTLVGNGDPAPVFTGGTFDLMRFDAFQRLTGILEFGLFDMLALTSEVTGDPRTFGLFLAHQQGIERIALMGDAIPGDDQSLAVLPSPRDDFAGGAGIILNASGDVSFVARLCCGRYPNGLFLARPLAVAVPNGSFERPGNDSLPEDWPIVWNNTGSGRVFQPGADAQTAFRGERLLRLQVDLGGGSTFVLSDGIPVAPNAHYVLASRMRFQLAGTSDSVFFSVIQYDSQDREVGLDEQVGRKGDSEGRWRAWRQPIRTQSRTTHVRIRFGLSSSAEAVLDVDGVR